MSATVLEKSPAADELFLPREILLDHLHELPAEDIARVERLSTSVENENKRIVFHAFYSVLRMWETISLGIQSRRYKAKRRR